MNMQDLEPRSYLVTEILLTVRIVALEVAPFMYKPELNLREQNENNSVTRTPAAGMPVHRFRPVIHVKTDTPVPQTLITLLSSCRAFKFF
jgi:hypothetical protein